MYTILRTASTDSMPIFFVLAIGCLIVYVIRLRQIYAGTPPGPWGIPLFGYSVFLSREAYRDFMTLSKIYGKTFSLGIGTRQVTILNNYNDIKDAFLRPGGIFHGRELYGSIRDDLCEDKMIVGIDGKRRQLQKKLLVRAMKDFGLAHSRVEESIQMESKLVIDEISSRKNNHVNFTPLMRSFSSNVISHLMFGKRFSYNDKNAIQALYIIDDMANSCSFISPLFAISHHLSWLPDKLKGMDVIQQGKAILYELVDKVLDNHEKTFDENCMRDILDVYIREQSVKHKNNPLYDEVFSKPYTRANSLLMFMAGTDSTASFLGLIFQVMAGHPDIQKQLQEEIDNVLGSNMPSIRDLSRMPFAEAVILELMRFITPFPISLYHRVTEKTKFNGYLIPKNAFVIANYWGANHDPELWDNPETFRPQRFLGKEGIVAELRDQVIFFSLGKTRCLGEPIARMEIFILFIAILQTFSLSLPESQKWKFEPDYYIPITKKIKNILHVSEREC